MVWPSYLFIDHENASHYIVNITFTLFQFNYTSCQLMGRNFQVLFLKFHVENIILSRNQYKSLKKECPVTLL